jgi:hypothetical protein
MRSVRDVFVASFLLDEAGDGAFARGAVYEREDRVKIVTNDPRRVEAIVHGTEPYALALWVEHGRPGWFCACPAALDGSLCKHLVAAGLAVTGRPAGETDAPADFGPPPAPVRPTRPLDDADVREWGKQVTKAFAAGGRFVDYRHAPQWAAGVHDMLDDLQRLLDASHAEAVIKLTEQAHKRAETALQRIDDSAGWLTDIARRIADLHRAAAERARPKPRPFAKRLFALETSADTLDTFHRAAATYADVLGRDGLDRYRQLANDAWRTVDHDDRYGAEFRIREARIGVAIGARDPDELIAAREGDLHSPYDHLEIVELLGEVGRTDDAIDWARRGLSEFADRWHQTPKLRDALAELLVDQGDATQVEELYWDAYATRPSLTAYVQYVDHATDPDAARSRATDYLRAQVGTPLGDGRATYLADELIQILDHAGRDQEAWDTMVEHGCHHELAMRLANKREATHPLDAIAVYDRDVEQLIDRKNKTAYRAAVRQLRHIHTLSTLADQPEVAATIIDRVRTEHRLKRTLMGFLDGAALD